MNGQALPSRRSVAIDVMLAQQACDTLDERVDVTFASNHVMSTTTMSTTSFACHPMLVRAPRAVGEAVGF